MTANREKGEVSLQIGETSYLLKATINGMIAAEDESSAYGDRLSWDEITKRGSSGDLRFLVLYFWALTRKHHPELTRERIGELIDDAGGLPGLLQVIQKAVGAAEPDKADIKTLGIGAKGGKRTGRPR